MRKSKCIKCGYEWISRVEKPKACPSCKQYQRERTNTIRDSRALANKLMRTLHPEIDWHMYCVHHIDENPFNNDINNLKIINKSEHTALHRSGKKTCILERQERKKQRRKGKMKERIDLIVTRHPGLVEYLRELGMVGSGVEVIDHATPEKVAGRHVCGVLPHSLSALTASFTEVPLRLTPELRGKELDLKTLREIADAPVTYKVEVL
jgi:hypothetical protein